MLGAFLADQVAQLCRHSDNLGSTGQRNGAIWLNSWGFLRSSLAQRTAPESWAGILGFSISLVLPEELLLAPQCSHTETLPDTRPGAHRVEATAQSMGEGMVHVGPQQGSWISSLPPSFPSSLHTGSAARLASAPLRSNLSLQDWEFPGYSKFS